MDAAVLERAFGCLLGQAAGDALGTTVEFMSPDRIRAHFPRGLREIVGGGPFELLRGQITDDTELALALARSIADRRRFEPDDVGAAYVAWYRSAPFDVGGTTALAFGGPVELGAGLASRLETHASKDSQANGALMRVSPLGVFGWASGEALVFAMASADARMSHPHPVCQAASAVFAVAIAHAVKTGESAIHVYEAANRVAADTPVADVIEAAASERPLDYMHHMGWVRTALQNAFFQLVHASSLEDGVIDTVMRGGDTDTNAAIAGALLGAVHGASSIPAQWREAVLACASPRPRAYHTTDLREVATALVSAAR